MKFPTIIRRTFLLFINTLFPPNKVEKELMSLDIENLTSANDSPAPWIYPILSYRDPIARKLIHYLKYKKSRQAIKISANILHDHILDILASSSVLNLDRQTLLIPIPLTNKRKRERGYNQCVLLGKVINKISKKELFMFEPNLLEKVRETEVQTKLSRQERLQNIRGTFAVTNKSKVADTNMILLDDVTTTGATLSEARKVLLDAGACKVIAITLAH